MYIYIYTYVYISIRIYIQYAYKGVHIVPPCDAFGQSYALLPRERMIAWLDLDKMSIGGNITILTSMIIGFRFLAYLALLFILR
jgi:hypothetical protein